MAEQFAASPARLRGVSVDLSEVSSKMKAVMARLAAQLAAEGTPWGVGELADQFSNGPGGYVALRSWVEGSVAAKAGLLDGYADLLWQAADVSEGSDQG